MLLEDGRQAIAWRLFYGSFKPFQAGSDGKRRRLRQTLQRLSELDGRLRFSESFHGLTLLGTNYTIKLYLRI